VNVLVAPVNDDVAAVNDGVPAVNVVVVVDHADKSACGIVGIL
jgi:hypothetical protein